MAESMLPLSASTNGRPVQVGQTAIATGTVIHTHDGTGTDYVTLYASNNDVDGETRQLTIGHGGVTEPDLYVTPIACKQGKVLICDREPLKGGLSIRAAADEVDDVRLSGFVVKVV